MGLFLLSIASATFRLGWFVLSVLLSFIVNQILHIQSRLQKYFEAQDVIIFFKGNFQLLLVGSWHAITHFRD